MKTLRETLLIPKKRRKKHRGAKNVNKKTKARDQT